MDQAPSGAGAIVGRIMAAPPDETLGAVLRDARTRRGLSLRDVERRTGIRNAHLSQIETDTIAKPEMALLWELASALRAGLPAAARARRAHRGSGRGGPPAPDGRAARPERAVAGRAGAGAGVHGGVEGAPCRRLTRPVADPFTRGRIERIADRALREAGVMGQLPTPLEDVQRAAGHRGPARHRRTAVRDRDARPRAARCALVRASARSTSTCPSPSRAGASPTPTRRCTPCARGTRPRCARTRSPSCSGPPAPRSRQRRTTAPRS